MLHISHAVSPNCLSGYTVSTRRESKGGCYDGFKVQSRQDDVSGKQSRFTTWDGTSKGETANGKTTWGDKASQQFEFTRFRQSPGLKLEEGVIS